MHALYSALWKTRSLQMQTQQDEALMEDLGIT